MKHSAVTNEVDRQDTTYIIHIAHQRHDVERHDNRQRRDTRHTRVTRVTRERGPETIYDDEMSVVGSERVRLPT